MATIPESRRGYPVFSTGGRFLFPCVVSTGVLIPVVVGLWTTPYIALATLSYMILLAGIMMRKTRKLHAGMMGFGMTLDVMLVLILELQRQAVHMAVSSPLSVYQYGHIASSLLAVTLYIPVAILGGLRLGGRGTPALHKAHGWMGGMAMIFRSIGFLLMFSMLGVDR